MTTETLAERLEEKYGKMPNEHRAQFLRFVTIWAAMPDQEVNQQLDSLFRGETTFANEFAAGTPQETAALAAVYMAKNHLQRHYDAAYVALQEKELGF